MVDCTITADGNSLILRIPSGSGSDLSHTVAIPPTEAGLRVIQRILIHRAKATRPQNIGTVGSPTQEMVRAWLARERAERQPIHPELEIIELDL